MVVGWPEYDADDWAARTPFDSGVYPDPDGAPYPSFAELGIEPPR